MTATPRLIATALAAAVALCASLATASGAFGAFHQVKIKDVHKGTGGSDPDYIQLQMYANNENFVSGKYIAVFQPGALFIDPAFQFTSNAASGQNQRTILIAQAAMTPTPDFIYPLLNLPMNTNGAVCYSNLASAPWAGTGIDCVSFGPNFPTDFGLDGAPSPVGSPAQGTGVGGGLAAGDTLRRSIARGCPSLLEAIDDTDDSVADFAIGASAPRNNSMPPADGPCADTRITRGPKGKIRNRRPVFRFRSTVPGSTFRCKLDKGPFRPCKSPRRLKRLKLGRHTFRVRAINPQGVADPTPAKRTFRVVKRKRR